MSDYKVERLVGMKFFGFGPEVMKQTKVCRVCHHTCSAEESHCDECGAVLSRETLFDLYKTYHLYCLDCDTVVSSNARFCPECGKALRKQRALFGPRKMDGA